MNSETFIVPLNAPVYPGTEAFPLAIAEEALALLAAFTDQDIEEIRFRTTLLLNYAHDARCTELATACQALLEQAAGSASRQLDTAVMLGSFEQVIAATADIVVPSGDS